MLSARAVPFDGEGSKIIPGRNHFAIGPRQVGGGQCLVIAEAGVNHDGDPAKAIEMIDVAAAAGADAIKFQTFRAEAVISAGAPKADYQRRATDAAESQLDMIRRLELGAADFRNLNAHCRTKGILFLSTPFDEASVDLLAEIEVPAFKAPSGEITNLPLLDYIGRQGRPVILSTGMADLAEVGSAVNTIRGAGCPALALLHCVSNYPADPADANLRAMATMRKAFDLPVGFSDHTTGIDIALAAAALGAAVIEKHFTLDKALPGPDHQASLGPAELSALVAGIRRVESALGDGVKTPCPAEADTAAVARRSLFLSEPVIAGQDIPADHIVALRPAGGIEPHARDRVAGRRAARDLPAGAMLQWSDLV